MKGGCFITLEGVEGCGKSTQLQHLKRFLEDRGVPVVLTREPGGTAISEAIRNLLLDPANTAMASETELLLYAAARAQHVSERIVPALLAGNFVLCDRFSDSTTAYQGYGRGLPLPTLASLHKIATQGCDPNLTLLLDLPAAQGLERARHRGRSDRIESEALAFHERVREGFLQIAAHSPKRITIIDAGQPEAAVAAAVCACVAPLLDGWTT
ncbi:MAG: dTMP kinase [Candidatus Hydrogenedentes bacterium]|nr:dTMP kinase [Candidatus Hydrogenedentota bacterium]